MATASGEKESFHNDMSLGEDDLKELYETLYPVRTRYYYIGLQIVVKSREIQTIKAEHSRLDDRLREVLIARLKMTEALTWKDILGALRSKMVGEPRLADNIVQRYLKRSNLDKQSEVLSNRASKRRNSGSLENKKEQCLDVKQSEMYKRKAESGKFRQKTRGVKKEPSIAPGKDGPGACVSEESYLDSNRDLEVTSANEDESSAVISAKKARHNTVPTEERKIYGGKMRVNVTSTLDPSGKGREQQEFDIKQRKRTRKKRSITRFSSTSQEEKQYYSEKKPMEVTKRGTFMKIEKEVQLKNTYISSETDDSSPQCDMTKIITKKDSDQLIKIFSRFFGRLCCAIANLEEMAAHLQEKCLILNQ